MRNSFKKIADTSKESAKKWESSREDAVVHTRSCPACGAARPVNTNLAHCAYCGFKYMAIDRMLKPNSKP